MKKRAESLTEAAERLSELLGGPVTVGQVRHWRAKGYNLADKEELVVALLSAQRCPEWIVEKFAGENEEGGRPTAAELKYRYALARTLKTEWEAKQKEVDYRAAVENWITREVADETGRQIGAVLRSQLLQLPATLTPQLQGLAAAPMRAKIQAEVARMLQELKRLMLEKGVPPE